MAPTTYTPPINTYVQLESIVLTNAASSVTFFNIAQSDANGTYKDLVLVINAKNTVGTVYGAFLRFNGSSTSSPWVSMTADGTTTGSGTTSISYVLAGWLDNGQADTLQTSIMDYTATDKHKTVISKGGGFNRFGAVASRWPDTSAITSIEIVCEPTASWVAGATFSLYALHG